MVVVVAAHSTCRIAGSGGIGSNVLPARGLRSDFMVVLEPQAIDCR